MSETREVTVAGAIYKEFFSEMRNKIIPTTRTISLEMEWGRGDSHNV